MSDTEKLFIFGLLGLIAWELWPKQPQDATAPLVSNDPLSNTPGWVQQLSAAEQYEYLNQVRMGDTIDNLLSIPQGPGGTSNYSTSNVSNFQPVNFFNPTQGILGLCAQASKPSVPVRVQVFS